MKQGMRLLLKGVVQGVGFRPFVYKLAQKYHLQGFVSNTGEGLIIEIEGSLEGMHLFCDEIQNHPPSLARINQIVIQEQNGKHFEKFDIIESVHCAKTTSISPDIAVCELCLSEMNGPHNRRFGYYLINCTDCGPRYSIMETLPYDRAFTSMRWFEMCPECQAEYNDPSNRRYHAQPISCPSCGPVMTLADSQMNLILKGSQAIEKTAELLKNGSIVAVKGIGGFHLMCDAGNEQAVSRLRLRKKRPHKPLAVMFSNMDHLRSSLSADHQESALLDAKERPIVLLKKGSSNSLARNIAPDIDTIGAMLAYAPLHHLLFSFLSFPLVATSANRSNEPIIRSAHELHERLGTVVDYIVDFNRDIVNAVDDSIIQVIQNRRLTLRLGRGYAPYTLFQTQSHSLNILAVGAQQKNTIGLAFEDKMILSPHIGDLHSLEGMEYFERTVDSFKRFYDFSPDVIVCDMHPGYATAQWAKDQGVECIEVQHHYAHALACMAEHGLNEKLLAFCFDGTGYGDDGTIWGGEVFLADPLHYERIGHIKPFRLLGGEKAIKEPKRVALSLLFESYSLAEVMDLTLPLLEHFDSQEITLYHKIWEKGLNAPLCSSVGRVFDAIASFCDITHEESYEGEAGRRLEELYNPHSNERFEYTVQEGAIDLSMMIREIVILVQSKEFAKIATRYINTLVTVMEEFSRFHPDLSIVLSGGVFQNKTLLSLVLKQWEEKGRKVYFQEQTPINDGGIALGQLYYVLSRSRSNHGH